MADDQYEGREARYSKNIAETIGAFTVAIVKADSMAKDAAADRTIRLLQGENVKAGATISLIGSDTPLNVAMSLPRVAFTKVGPIEIEKATLKMGMTVSASQESASHLDSKTNIQVGASVGWGPFKASTKINSTISVSSDQKRKSDYSAHVDADVTMSQAEPPEGVKLVVDAINELVRVGLEISKARANDQLTGAGDVKGNPQIADVVKDDKDKEPEKPTS